VVEDDAAVDDFVLPQPARPTRTSARMAATAGIRFMRSLCHASLGEPYRGVVSLAGPAAMNSEISRASCWG